MGIFMFLCWKESVGRNWLSDLQYFFMDLFSGESYRNVITCSIIGCFVVCLGNDYG